MKKISKAQLFKQLIKEAVREVIQEEVRDIIREELRNTKPLIKENKIAKPIPGPMSTTSNSRNPYEEFLPGIQQVKARQQAQQAQIKQIQGNKPKSPIEQLLFETKQNMTAEDFSAHTNTGNAAEVMPNFGSQVDTNQLSPELANSIGEIEDWNPTSVNLPMPPIPGMR